MKAGKAKEGERRKAPRYESLEYTGPPCGKEKALPVLLEQHNRRPAIADEVVKMKTFLEQSMVSDVIKHKDHLEDKAKKLIDNAMNDNECVDSEKEQAKLKNGIQR